MLIMKNPAEWFQFSVVTGHFRPMFATLLNTVLHLSNSLIYFVILNCYDSFGHFSRASFEKRIFYYWEYGACEVTLGVSRSMHVPVGAVFIVTHFFWLISKKLFEL